jgi:hypothetical protein
MLSCVIFSLFAASPPVVDTNAAAVTMVWKYIRRIDIQYASVGRYS